MARAEEMFERGMHYQDIAEVLERENDRLRETAQDMLKCFEIGANSGEGIDRQWCRELFDSYSVKLRELGSEVPE